MFEERHRPAIEFDDDDEEEGGDGEDDGGDDGQAGEGGKDGDRAGNRMRPKRVWEGPTVPPSLLPVGKQFETKDAQSIVGGESRGGSGRETIVDLKATCLCSAEEAVAYMKRSVIGVSVHELDEECCVMLSDRDQTVLVIESGPDAWEIKFSMESADHFRSRNADPVLHAISKSVVLCSKMSECPEDFLGAIGFSISHRYSRKGFRVLLRTGLVAEFFCISTTTDSLKPATEQEMPLLRIYARYEEKKAAERGQMTARIASLFRKLGSRAVLISDR